MPGFGKDQKGQILWRTASVATLTISPQTVIELDQLLEDLTEDFRILKMELYCVIDPVAEEDYADGPVLLLVADGDLTIAEIEECIESGAIERGDQVELEESHRPVWPLGLMQSGQFSDADSAGILTWEGVWKPRWTFTNGNGIRLVSYLLAGNALAGTVNFRYVAKFFGVWVT